MAASTYDAALARVLAHEGGYTNHASDPGGPTKFGITIASYRTYVKADATAGDVRAMSVDEAPRIYRARYWDALRCDELPAGVDYAVFDYGVNSGIGRSGKVLRRLLKLPDNTNIVSDAVIAAARAADAGELTLAICDERLRFLRSLKTWDVFGKGWGRRVAEVKAAALDLAATAQQAPNAAAPARARGVAATAVAAAAGAAAAGEAYRSGMSLAVVICLIAVAAAAGWLLWRRRQQQERPA